jgi:ABC-type Na+ transport system ATPase subunit NatA
MQAESLLCKVWHVTKQYYTPLPLRVIRKISFGIESGDCIGFVPSDSHEAGLTTLI